ncbi:hypothetical protein N9955_00745 [bacterium]|nr:hypothetical protein [bacterium]
MSDKYTYEDKQDELEEVLSKYRAKWQLDVFAWLNYDDVCQMVRLRVWQKFHLWNQDLPFKPWASTLTGNAIKNVIRDNYGNFARPCLKCEFFQGADGCSFTQSKIQDEECPKFAKWKKKKERAYNLKLALPIEDGGHLGESHFEDEIDFFNAESKLHKMVMAKLKGKHLEIYRLLFVEHMDEEEVAERYGFKKDASRNKTTRYKQINNLKKRFYKMAQKIVNEEDIV